MTQQERLAWFNLIVVAITALAILCLIPIVGLNHAYAGFGVLGILGFGPMFFRKPKSNGVVLSDERDHQIQMKAWTVSTAIFWVTFVIASVSIGMGTNYWGNGTISSDLLVVFPFGGLMLLTTVQSLVTLTLYARGRSDA